MTTIAPTEPTMEQQRTTLAAALADIQARIEQLRDTETLLKAQLLATTSGPDTYTAGTLAVIVKVAHRLDAAAAAAKYPADTHPELYTLMIDTKKVRAHLAPIDLKALSVAGAPSVTLK